MTRRYRDENDRMMRDMNWDGSDDGYDYSYDYAPRPPLRRNKIDGMLGGVCAGIGDWIGMDHGLVRLLFVLSVIFFGFPLFLYFLAWLFISKDNRAPYVRERRERQRAHRKAKRRSPAGATAAATATGPEIDPTSYSDVRSKFRSLEERLQDLERSVTSREWKLRRDFRDLES
jgi:phage shock protein C